MLELRSINQLYKKQFFIPHYQRGYRWTDLQVKQLLDDIDSFNPVQIVANTSEQTFYCLQPVAVKLLPDEIKEKYDLSGDWYEVVDGQQRLTTIFIILQYINQNWRGRTKIEQFFIFYETRLGSQTFLENLKVNDDDTVSISKEYIDYYYFSKALLTIKEWEDKYLENKNKEFTSSYFETKFLNNSKIIWYEVNEQDGRKLFERLNLGKIPLTNSELVKALFLSSESFKNYSLEEKRIKQFEVARLWDEIEHKLNEKDLKFWSFISNKDRNDYETKIELILDLLTEKDPNERDELFTFLKLYRMQNAEVDGLDEVWKKIQRFYLTLQQWYFDQEYYHKIGYLVASRNFGTYSGIDLNQLVNYALTETKADFRKRIDSLISDSVNFELSELRYDNQGHQSKIFNALLLSNVVTCLQSEASIEFYPFKLHKQNNWSFEHIHARKSKINESKKESWLQWLDLHIPILEEYANKNTQGAKELCIEISQYNNDQITWQRFSSIFSKVNDFFTEEVESMDKESEGIPNLALLSQPDNAVLNNSVFEVKRREIIRLDKEGHFIPICTKRAFLKYYSDENSTSQNYFWSSHDREKYFDAIKDLLSEYLPKSTEINEIEDNE